MTGGSSTVEISVVGSKELPVADPPVEEEVLSKAPVGEEVALPVAEESVLVSISLLLLLLLLLLSSLVIVVDKAANLAFCRN